MSNVTEEQVRYWVGEKDPIAFLTNLINEEDEAGFSGHGFNLELLRTEIRNTFLFYCDEGDMAPEMRPSSEFNPCNREGN